MADFLTAVQDALADQPPAAEEVIAGRLHRTIDGDPVMRRVFPERQFMPFWAGYAGPLPALQVATGLQPQERPGGAGTVAERVVSVLVRYLFSLEEITPFEPYAAWPHRGRGLLALEAYIRALILTDHRLVEVVPGKSGGQNLAIHVTLGPFGDPELSGDPLLLEGTFERVLRADFKCRVDRATGALIDYPLEP